MLVFSVVAGMKYLSAHYEPDEYVLLWCWGCHLFGIRLWA